MDEEGEVTAWPPFSSKTVLETNDETDRQSDENTPNWAAVGSLTFIFFACHWWCSCCNSSQHRSRQWNKRQARLICALVGTERVRHNLFPSGAHESRTNLRSRLQKAEEGSCLVVPCISLWERVSLKHGWYACTFICAAISSLLWVKFQLLGVVWQHISCVT